MKWAVVISILFIWVFLSLPLDVSISFDLERDPPAATGWEVEFSGIEQIPQLLSVLEKHGAKSTFFVTGRVVHRFPEVITHIDNQGHEIGVHGSFFHDERLKGLPRSRQRDKILATITSIKNLTEKAPTGYRAPGHAFDDATLNSLEDLNITYDSSVVPSLGGWYLYDHPIYAPPHPYYPGGVEVLEIPTTPVLFDGNLDSLLAYQGTLITKAELFWATFKAKVTGTPLVLYLHPGMMANLENSPKDYRASTARLKDFEGILDFLDLFQPRYMTLEEIAKEYSR
jgi:peptidoglycan/xylan/chitin deacetylase (PgdA/CDA1 family)